jgi:hypothetical protein
MSVLVALSLGIPFGFLIGSMFGGLFVHAAHKVAQQFHIEKYKADVDTVMDFTSHATKHDA